MLFNNYSIYFIQNKHYQKKEVEKRPTTQDLLCDVVVEDYIFEMYESRLNYVSEKEIHLRNEENKKKDEEIKRKDEEIKKTKEEKDEEIKRRDEEIKKVREEKDKEIKRKDEELEKVKEEKDEEIRRKGEEIKKVKEEIKRKDEEIKKVKKENDEKMGRKDKENKEKDDEIKKKDEEINGKDEKVKKVEEEKQQYINFINNFPVSRILCFLPKDDKTDTNIEIGNEILNLLVTFSEILFCDDNKGEYFQFRSKLEKCHCFKTLLFLLNIYENISFKVRISIILGNSYKYINIPNEGKIIINVLINYLKEQFRKKSSEDKNDKLIKNTLKTLINITKGNDKNRKILLDSGIIQLLLLLDNSSDTNVFQSTIVLLSDIFDIESVEDKNSIISRGIFDVFHKKLLEISPFPPQKMISSNYYSIYLLIAGISNLLISNRSGVTSFLKTPLIPLLFHIFDSTISIGNTSSDKDIGNIQLYICKCFSKSYSYENTFLLIKMKMIDFLLKVFPVFFLILEIMEQMQDLKKKKTNSKIILMKTID
jgi:hypothetical protein